MAKQTNRSNPGRDALAVRPTAAQSVSLTVGSAVSLSSHPVEPDLAERGVCVVSDRYPAFEGPWHAHQSAQFVYACQGLLTVHTRQGFWIVPPHRAVWLPPAMEHKVTADRPVHLRTLYVKPGHAPTPTQPSIVSVDALLDALLSAAAALGTQYPLGGSEERLVAVILDRLPQLEAVPSYLPSPTDPRLVRLTALLKAQLADPRTLDELASECGMTARTAARLFVKETGLTFGEWRQQLRLLIGMQWLSQGQGVTAVALGVGYQDVSAFITAFKRAFGATPARYFRRD